MHDSTQNRSVDLENPNEVERCVLCGMDTGYVRCEPIELRQYYIEGSGQLCKKCFLQLQVEDI